MKKHTLLTGAILLLLTQIKGQTENYNDKKCLKIVAQKSSLDVNPLEAKISKEIQGTAVIAAAILPPLIELGVSTAKNISTKNALKYTGTYKCNGSTDSFYKGKTGEDIKVNLPKLIISRDIIIKGESASASAVKITLTPELSPDKTAYRFVIDSNFDYFYSIAKTTGEYDYLEVNIDIKVKALSVNESKYELSDLRGTSITIPFVKVGGTNAFKNKLYSGWIPLPPVNKISYKKVKEITKEETITVKSSTKGKGAPEVTKDSVRTESHKFNIDKTDLAYTNSGLLEFELTVTETNLYKARSEDRQKLIENSADPTTALLKAIIGAATKTEEAKTEESTEESK